MVASRRRPTAVGAPMVVMVLVMMTGAATALHMRPRRAPRAWLRAVETEVEAPASNPRSSGLGLALDEGTRKVHSVAENTQFVTGFFKGLAERRSFSRLTAAFYFVYREMEQSLDASQAEAVRAMDYPELRRLPALERDMAYFFGPQWRDAVEPSPATAIYVQRIRTVATDDQPELLLGHMYSRYLGDLFGGQMMAGMATKSLGLRGADGGLAFYTFGDVADYKALITRWYTDLNAVGEALTEAQRAVIVDEANVVFRLNIDLFNELEGNFFQSALAVAIGTLKDKVKAALS